MSTIILIITTLFLIALIKLCKLYAERLEFLRKVENFPGPPPLPILGNALEIKGTTEILPLFQKCTKQYGLTFKLSMGPSTKLFTSDPKLIQSLITSNTQITKSSIYRFLYNWLGNGLLTASNPKWKIHRRMLTPTFHFKILEDCIPIFHSNAKNLKDHLEQKLGRDVNIHQDVVLNTLDIICETAMGFQLNALNEGSSSNYVNSVKYMTKMVVERTFSIWRQFDMLYKNSPSYKYEKKAVDYLHNVTNTVIKVKRQELLEKKKSDIKQSEDETYGKGKCAFLDMLLKCSTAEGGTLSDYDIRQEVDTFMFAGHDTTSSAISFLIHALSKHQDIQEKVFQEVSEILEDADNITMEKLSEMKYLEMVIKESLRMFPPVPMIARELTDDVIFDGQLFPKGLPITMLPFVVHRLEEIYENPEEFIPERFTIENCAKRPAFTYIPFSAGPRNCIGQKFAMLAMKSVISSLLLHFKFVASEIPMQLASESVLTSLNGIHVKVEKR